MIPELAIRASAAADSRGMPQVRGSELAEAVALGLALIIWSIIWWSSICCATAAGAKTSATNTANKVK